MYLAVNFLVSAFLLFFPFSANSRDVSVLIIGQSVSANCNEFKFGPSSGVFQYDLDGGVVPAVDPLLWADCDSGSIWMPFSERLRKYTNADRVILMSVGVRGSSIDEWFDSGVGGKKLKRVIEISKLNKISYDYAIWLQGTANIGMDGFYYREKLRRLIAIFSRDFRVEKWLIAIHSRCFGLIDQGIAEAQAFVARAHRQRRFVGANMNLISDDLRFDGCHLNKDGQLFAADMWLKAVVDADLTSEDYSKETLLNLFR